MREGSLEREALTGLRTYITHRGTALPEESTENYVSLLYRWLLAVPLKNRPEFVDLADEIIDYLEEKLQQEVGPANISAGTINYNALIVADRTRTRTKLEELQRAYAGIGMKKDS